MKMISKMINKFGLMAFVCFMSFACENSRNVKSIVTDEDGVYWDFIFTGTCPDCRPTTATGLNLRADGSYVAYFCRDGKRWITHASDLYAAPTWDVRDSVFYLGVVGYKVEKLCYDVMLLGDNAKGYIVFSRSTDQITKAVEVDYDDNKNGHIFLRKVR